MKTPKTVSANAAHPKTERPYLRAVPSLPPSREARRRRRCPVKRGVTEETRRFDPLSREQGRKRYGRTAASYGLLALFIHGAIVSALILFGGGERRLPIGSEEEKVYVEIKEPSIPESVPVPAAVEEVPSVVEEKFVKSPRRLDDAPRRRPVEAADAAVADPVNKTDSPPDTAARRKVVGINFESTVTGGLGPAFAVGNTRMGETGAKAENASGISSLPRGKTKGDVESSNRIATAIPTAGVSLVKPVRNSKVEPNYPPLLKARGIEGNVVVLIRIDAAGRVSGAKVVKGSGYAEFDIEAERAAAKERFSPALRNGEPIEYTLTYTYRFRVYES